MGLSDSFKRIRDGLSRTRSGLIGRIAKVISTKTKIDDDLIGEIEQALLASDIGYDATEKIVKDLRLKVKNEGYDSPGMLGSLLKEEIASSLIGSNGHEQMVSKPTVIMVVGVNGVGKTTTVGKLAYNFKNEGKKVLIAAADTFRAAANEQLKIWADRAGVELIQQRPGTDPGAVAYDAVGSAKARKMDVVLIDTAGRLHTKSNLMEELRKSAAWFKR